MFMLIWKNISRRRTQSVLTVAITLLTVFVFVMVMGIYQTMNTGLELSRQRLGADAVLLPKYSTADSGDLLFTALPENIYMPAETVEQAKSLEGVAALSPQFYAQTLSLSCCEPGEEARVIGFDPETDFILAPYLDGGISNIKENDMIMGGNFDDDFIGSNYLALGNKFYVPMKLQPTGTGMDSTLFMHIDTLRRLCRESEALNTEYLTNIDWREDDPFAYVSVIMIKLQEGVDPDDFAMQVEKSGMNVRCVLTGATISSLQGQLEVTMRVMLALWLASMIIAILSLTGRFSALAKERKKEIGLLRAIGARKQQIFGLIIGEACTMALIGGVIGSVLALLCMGPVIDMLKEAFKLSPSVWSTDLAVLCGTAGVVLAGILGFAAALLPASKSASLDPQTAITQGEVA